jgi:hypothetical protein
MKPIVFLGPTLPIEEARAELDALYLPPVAQGDVYRAALHRPPAIGIVDGYFDWVPAVWHKEILWAISEGIPVYGSGSIGALRAAELWPFGMQGVGDIFCGLRDGILEDDDEVALMHAPAGLGFAPLTEPMVNVRATLDRAEMDRVITPGTRRRLEALAKSLFYGDRNWPAIIARGRADGLPETELDALSEFYPAGRIDQKRLDAVAMLRLMRERLGQPGSQHVNFHFEHTGLWEQVRRSAGELEIAQDASARLLLNEELLDELRLEGNTWQSFYERALVRLTLLAEARLQCVSVNEDELLKATIEFRRERNLITPDELERWIVQNRLDHHGFLALMRQRAIVAAVKQQAGPTILGEILNEMRLQDRFEALNARCRDKRQCLGEWDAPGASNDGSNPDSLSDEMLVAWYARERLCTAIPEDVNSYARSLGFSGSADLLRALRREWRYQQAVAKRSAGRM